MHFMQIALQGRKLDLRSDPLEPHNALKDPILHTNRRDDLTERLYNSQETNTGALSIDVEETCCAM